MTAKSYFKIIGDLSTETVVTAYVYGIPGVEYTKVFDASFLVIKIDTTGNEIEKIVVLENNLILATKVEHIQHKYLYQGTRMELRG